MPLLGAAMLLCAGLYAVVDSGPLPAITPREAEAWEGSRVVLRGVVQAAYPTHDGATRLLVAGGGHGLWAQVDGWHEPTRGAWVELEGHLWRRGVELELRGGPGGRVVVGLPPAPLEPTWDQLARDPSRWVGVPLRLAGIVDGSTLRADGNAVRLGTGDWPSSGPAVATGTLAYQSPCLCYRLDAAAVDVPWTP